MTVTANDDLLRAVAASGATLPLTLVTGDKVYVGIDANGKPVVRDTESAARPDGSSVVFHTITRRGVVHVVPNDALSLLGSGLLDWGLFDLTKLAMLAASGTVGEVPVLVTYTEKATADKALKAAGATVDRALPSIGGRSMTIAGDGRWWQDVRGKTSPGAAAARSAGSLEGVRKVWLNELARISLDSSVPQIGAPVAWDRGYDGTGVTVAVLDTGIDPNHPDVAGKIVEEVDFSGNANGVRDGHGHGTHVAATILGTGAASNGLRKGVAPGAQLRVGKICNDGGSCELDAIIAGMEWAANSGAKVVNMSIGGGATDGTDPMSEALNQLSRDTGTLFVVAAGNSGPSSGTVGAPGAADEALTVAAVDKEDQMADFSSRGPRIGDGAAKPDIAAPGVDIVAARAAGTSMGTAVDEYYTSASGTSMATPHVAGAATIIAQQHPELTGQQIKALLMGTATDLGHDIYAQGVGRVNVATAVDPTIIAGGTLSFGRLAYPHSPLTRTVTYTNHTDEAITLHLTTSISAGDQPAPAGLFTLSADEVTVPGKGSAEVTVTVDGRVLGTDGVFGRYTGLVNARDSAGALRAASRVNAFLEPERFGLTVNVVHPKDATNVRYGDAIFLPVDDKVLLHDGPVTMDGADTMTAPLFGGTYSAAFVVEWQDAAGEWHTAVPVVAEVDVTKATTVTVDLRKLKPLKVHAPVATETYDGVTNFERLSATGEWGMTGELTATYGADEPNWWALPTDKVRTGTFSHNTYSVLATPVVTMNVIGGGPTFSLSSRYHTPNVSIPAGTQTWQENETDVSRDIVVPVPRLATRGLVPVVHAGTGSAADLAKVDARGKLVLITPTDICTTSCEFVTLRDERVAAAAAAGAVGVLVAAPGLTSLGVVPTQSATCTDGPQSCPAVQPYAALPIVSVSYDAADGLIKRLQRDSRHVRILLGGSAAPTVYAASFGASGQIPSNLPYRTRTRDFDRVDHQLHADRPGEIYSFTWQQQPKSGPAAVPLDVPLTATQRTLTTFVKRQGDAINRFHTAWADYAGESVLGQSHGETQDVALSGRKTLHWNTGPTVPGAVPQVRTRSGFTVQTGYLCSGCRQGDTFYPTFYLTGSGGGQQAMIGLVNDTGIGTYYFGTATCEPPACSFTLRNEAGDEVERRLVHLTWGIGGKSGATADLVGGRR
ncbi:S8 family peptidase [Micromonospora costi]|uniref:S8 family peptidase n=1 Tax=Micromonospora costi TaxID=1530042 RepID=UPI0019D43AA9|nr:S8 family serine peptidase [Micromonospora costi]